MYKRLLFVALMPLVLGASGPCSETSTTGSGVPGSIEGEGTMRQGVGPECPQTWHIAMADGRMFWPVDDPAFQTDGLRVGSREGSGAETQVEGGAGGHDVE